MGGVAWRGGGEARRLAKKVGALVRDPSPNSSLEGFQVEEARLRLWVIFHLGDKENVAEGCNCESPRFVKL